MEKQIKKNCPMLVGQLKVFFFYLSAIILPSG
jgi:hypothetical protein